VTRVAIITGGVLGEMGPAGRTLKGVIRQIAAFAPRSSDDDFAVDIGFFTWSRGLGPKPPKSPEEPGVTPWMVGRKQRRFIVQVAPPPGLEDEAALLEWLVPALDQVAELCRSYLPTKSREYPAEALAQEVEALAAYLAAPRNDQAPADA
jgi:hypothetical protein